MGAEKRTVLVSIIYALVVLFAFLVFQFIMIRLFGFSFLESFVLGMSLVLSTLVIFIVVRNFYTPLKPGYAAMGRRFWALVFDMLIIHIVIHFSLIIYVFLKGEFLKEFKLLYDDLLGTQDLFVRREMVILGIYIVYSMLFELLSAKGSIGRRNLDMRLATSEGKKPVVWQILLRNFLKFLIMAPMVYIFCWTVNAPLLSIDSALRMLLLLYLLPKLNPRRVFLYDQLSGMCVLDTKAGNLLHIESKD